VIRNLVAYLKIVFQHKLPVVSLCRWNH